jgi:hypothetical protein
LSRFPKTPHTHTPTENDTLNKHTPRHQTTLTKTITPHAQQHQPHTTPPNTTTTIQVHLLKRHLAVSVGGGGAYGAHQRPQVLHPQRAEKEPHAGACVTDYVYAVCFIGCCYWLLLFIRRAIGSVSSYAWLMLFVTDLLDLRM